MVVLRNIHFHLCGKTVIKLDYDPILGVGKAQIPKSSQLRRPKQPEVEPKRESVLTNYKENMEKQIS